MRGDIRFMARETISEVESHDGVKDCKVQRSGSQYLNICICIKE